MLTILDFQITRAAQENFHLDVCERGQSQPLVSAEMKYRLDFMAGFELERLDYDRRNPRGRLELLRAYGARLYEKLFASPDVRRVWREYRERGNFLTLCLRIDDDAAGLEALPWETLYDGEDFIAGGATTEITRLPLGVEPQEALLALNFPLWLLSFASSPLDLKENERLNVEAEQELLLRAVNDPAGQGKLMVDFEDEARREILEGSLDGGGYHILHYTGHGVSPGNGGGLLFENAAGEGQRISPEDFLESLDKAKASLRLAVISGCYTARTLYTGSFRDLARGILGRGVPAVAAMQFSLSDAGGLKFAEAFYPKLIAGQPLELALNAARRALLLTDDQMLRADAFAPVLLATNGECLRATTAAEAPQMPRAAPPFDLSTLPRLGFGFYGRRREYRQIRDGFAQRNHRAAIIWGVGGIGKTALVAHVADRLYHHRKIFSGVFAFDCCGGALSVERILLDLHRYLSLQGILSLEPLLHQSLPPEMAANLVGQLLSDLPLLVIFDNFEDLLEREADRFRIRDENLRTFITTLVKATPSGSRFLFTTRHLFDLGDRRLSDVLALPLGDLSRPEAIYLMQRMPQLGAKSHGSKAEVLERFGGHPLSLVLADEHCKFSPLAELLDRAGRLHTELREYLGIELNCVRLSYHSRELLFRLTAFRQPVTTAAAEWMMGEKISQSDAVDRILATLDRSKLPDEWKHLDDAALRAQIEAVLPERRSTPNLEGEIRELIECGLLTPVSKDGEPQGFAVHSLVREYSRDRQTGERWSKGLRDAAAFYTSLTRTLSAEDEDKDLVAVNLEMEAFELLMEAEDYEVAADLLTDNDKLLARWGFGLYLESQYCRVIDKVSGIQLATVTHNLAMRLHGRGKYNEALRRYEQSLQIVKELGNHAGAASLLNNIGILYQDRGEYGEALHRYEQSLQIAEELGDGVGVAGSLYQIGRLHQARGEYGEALRRYEQSLRIAEELGDRAGIARSLHQIGILHQARGEYGEALHCYEQSLRIEKEIGDRAGIGSSLHQLGVIHQIHGEYEKALQCYEQSLKIAEELGDRKGVAKSQHIIGMLHQARGEYDKALQCYRQSLRIAEDLGDRASVAQSLHQLGMLHQARGEYDEARQRYEQSLEIAEKLGDRASVAISLNQLGVLHQMRGEYDEALQRWKQSLRIAEELGDSEGVAVSLHNMGLLCQARGEYDEALRAYQQSLRMLEDLGDRAQVARSRGKIGQLFMKTGRYEEAFSLLMDALSTFMQLQSPDAEIAVNLLRDLRALWGGREFDAAWWAVTNQDAPAWLQ
ncbi:MAG: tetratricopeptide repeat protein [Blastocatellia bacterium]